MKQFIFILLMSLLPISGIAEQPSSKARELLEKAVYAVHQLNYDGIFVYHRENQLDSMRIIHKVDDSGEVERLISLTGANTEIVHDKQDITCIYPDDQTVMIDKGDDTNKFLPSDLPTSIPRIQHSYTFELLGEERIAGRLATIVEIAPKDNNRHIYRLWIDVASNMILKTTIVETQQQRNLETLMFTQLDIGIEIADELVKPMNTSQFSVHTNKLELKKPISTGWQVGWLPVGFEVEVTKTRALSDMDQNTHQLVYSDGLATASIFINKKEQDEIDETESGYTSLGAVNAYTLTKEHFQVTVVGEIPADTVFKIATSIEYNPTIE